MSIESNSGSNWQPKDAKEYWLAYGIGLGFKALEKLGIWQERGTPLPAFTPISKPIENEVLFSLSNDAKDYAKVLVSVHQAAKSYSQWKSQRIKSQNRETDFSIQNVNVVSDYSEIKRQTLDAMFNIYDIHHSPVEQRALGWKKFRNFYGEVGSEYEGVYRRIVPSKQDVNMFDVVDVLKDSAVSADRKVELFIKGGYTKGEAIKAVSALALAAGATALFSSTAEPGAIAAGAYGATNPFLEGLQIPNNLENVLVDIKNIGIDLATFGGFYGATWLYAKQNIRLLKETGFGLNVFATGAFHVDKALGVSSEVREKDVTRAVFGVNLALDAPYLATVLIPAVGTSMMAGSYTFGIAYTLAQAGLAEGIIQGASFVKKSQLNEKMGNLFSSFSRNVRARKILKAS